MNRPELYFTTTKVLFDAYQEETLFHNTNGCCACGQMIAAAMGYRVVVGLVKRGMVFSRWKKAGASDDNFINEWQWQVLHLSNHFFYPAYLLLTMGRENYRLQKKHLASTGYSQKELAKIVKAFDSCFDKKDETKNILPALKKVILVLQEIHKVTELDRALIFEKSFALENKILKELPARYNWIQEIEIKADNKTMAVPAMKKEKCALVEAEVC